MHTAAEATGMPTFASTYGMDSRDGIWTHAETTTASAPLILRSSTIRTSSIGSRLPTLMLFAIPSEIVSSTVISSASM